MIVPRSDNAMSTALAINDLLALRVWTVLGNQAAVSTFNFRCVAVAGISGTDTQMALAMDAIMAAFFPVIMADQAVYRGVQVYFLKRTGPLPNPVFSIANISNGTGGVNALPRNTAAILKYNTDIRGPGGRGRIYLPFCAADTMAPTGDPTAGFNTSVTAFGVSMLTDVVVGSGLNTAEIRWSLLHRGPVLTSTDIKSAASAGKFGQMHKRGDYGRSNSSPI
jgi:hypothetical protein